MTKTLTMDELKTLGLREGAGLEEISEWLTICVECDWTKAMQRAGVKDIMIAPHEYVGAGFRPEVANAARKIIAAREAE